ncbi:MAG: ribosomal protein S18 [Opitutales bacterium]|nr:ribosomal protein S18 [Opitutales bacterium]
MAKKMSILEWTWRDTDKLRKVTTETGKILPRDKTHVTAREQRHLTRIVKQSRNLLQMP